MPRRKRRRNADVQLHVRLYPGQDDDLIDWLEQLDERPFGAKTQALKDALLRGIGIELGQDDAATPAIDLAEVRHVVEAAFAAALSRFAQSLHPGEGGIAERPVAAPEDDEAEDLLDALGAALVLADDEA